MKVTRRTAIASVAALAMMATTVPLNALAQDVDFSGRTIEWVVPFPEGGGSGTTARYIQPYLNEYLPGDPTIVIRNIPGGGSINGANEFAARARSDGSQLLITSASTQFPFLLNDSRVRYDYAEWTPLAVAPTGGVVYLPSSFEVESAAELGELSDTELVYGSQGPTSLDLVPMIAFELLGLDVRYVFGMPGRTDGRLAFERGEATIDYQTSSAYLTNVVPLVEAGRAVPIFSWGIIDENGEFARDPSFPEIPHFTEAYEMMHGELPEGVLYDVYRAVFAAGFAAQKPIVVPADTPEDVIETYRQAFAQVAKDPEFIANRGDVIGEYDIATGAAAERLYQMATSMPAESAEWLQNYLSENYNVSF